MTSTIRGQIIRATGWLILTVFVATTVATGAPTAVTFFTESENGLPSIPLIREISVSVFNGNGTRMLATRTANYLEGFGFRVASIQNAETFSYKASYIIVLTDARKAWVLQDAIYQHTRIVFPPMIERHYEAILPFISEGTDIALIVGAGWEVR